MEGSTFKSITSQIKSVFKLLTVDRIAIAVILIIIGYATKVSFFQEEEKSLYIVANLVEINTQIWEMRGRVLIDGIPVDNARVWIILGGQGSNEDSPPAVFTNKQGEFNIQSIPRFFGKDNTTPKELKIIRPRAGADTVQRAGSEIQDKVKEVKIFAVSIKRK